MSKVYSNNYRKRAISSSVPKIKVIITILGKQKKQDKATDVIGTTSNNKTHAAESIQKNRKK